MVYGPVDGKMQRMAYDCRNRLIRAGDTVYEYDAENVRVSVTDAASHTEYVTDSNQELSQILVEKVKEGDEERETLYVYGNGLLGKEAGGGYLTYHFDHLGSTTALTDVNGEPVGTYTYGTYGELESGGRGDETFLYNGMYGVATDRNGLTT